jgi:hypothetical protein
LLTSVNDWNLSNTNAKTTNHQCIDLIDTDNKLGVQVTSECGAGKLNDTINCLSKHGMTMHIDKLKVFSLIPGQTSYAVKSTCPGVAFAWEADVLDFDGILRTITNISDLAHLQRIHNFETKSLPTVFLIRQQAPHALAGAPALPCTGRAHAAHARSSLRDRIAD